MTKNEIFRFLNSIQRTKEYNFDEEYNPFFTNLGLSQYVDSILYVNEMNLLWQVLPKQAQYDYYFNSIRQVKRPFTKWAKKQQHKNVQMIMDEYEVNYNRAQEYLGVLTEEQLKEIEAKRS